MAHAEDSVDFRVMSLLLIRQHLLKRCCQSRLQISLTCFLTTDALTHLLPCVTICRPRAAPFGGVAGKRLRTLLLILLTMHWRHFSTESIGIDSFKDVDISFSRARLEFNSRDNRKSIQLLQNIPPPCGCTETRWDLIHATCRRYFSYFCFLYLFLRWHSFVLRMLIRFYPRIAERFT